MQQKPSNTFKPKGNKPFNPKQGNKNPNFKPNNNNGNQKPVFSTIKKKLGLQPVGLETIMTSERRMYRVSIIFGSTVVADTFTVEGRFTNAMIPFRDKLLRSLTSLFKLLNKDVVRDMIPRINYKNMPVAEADIISMERKDLLHSLTYDVHDIHQVNGKSLVNTVISYRINPGSIVNGVTKRVVIRVKQVKDPNFNPKKKEPKSKKTQGE